MTQQNFAKIELKMFKQESLEEASKPDSQEGSAEEERDEHAVAEESESMSQCRPEEQNPDSLE